MGRTIAGELGWEGQGMKIQRENEGARGVDVNSGLIPSLIGRAFTGWLAPLRSRLHHGERPQPRLALLERVALAPRQSLALVEAEGRRFLVATSTEGGPVFYPLDNPDRPARERTPRVSW